MKKNIFYLIGSIFGIIPIFMLKLPFMSYVDRGNTYKVDMVNAIGLFSNNTRDTNFYRDFHILGIIVLTGFALSIIAIMFSIHNWLKNKDNTVLNVICAIVSNFSVIYMLIHFGQYQLKNATSENAFNIKIGAILFIVCELLFLLLSVFQYVRNYNLERNSIEINNNIELSFFKKLLKYAFFFMGAICGIIPMFLMDKVFLIFPSFGENRELDLVNVIGIYSDNTGNTIEYRNYNVLGLLIIIAFIVAFVCLFVTIHSYLYKNDMSLFLLLMSVLTSMSVIYIIIFFDGYKEANNSESLQLIKAGFGATLYIVFELLFIIFTVTAYVLNYVMFRKKEIE